MATEANKAKFRAALEGAVDKYVKQQGRNTIALNAERDSACAGYARIPGPDACEFCVTMGAANDFYRTEESAGGGAGHGSKDDAYHAHCNCQICMVFRRSGRLVARDPETGEAVPYDGAEMVRRYNEAGGPTFAHNRALENERQRIRRHGGEPSGSRSGGVRAKEIERPLDYIRSSQTAEEVEARFVEVYSQYKRMYGKEGMQKRIQSARSVGQNRVKELQRVTAAERAKAPGNARMVFDNEPPQIAASKELCDRAADIIESYGYNVFFGGEEAEAVLALRGEFASTVLEYGENNTFVGCNVYFRKNPTVSDIYEELYHVEQARRGDYINAELGIQETLYRREIDAQRYLIASAEKLKIPASETMQTKQALDYYIGKLDSLLVGRV